MTMKKMLLPAGVLTAALGLGACAQAPDAATVAGTSTQAPAPAVPDASVPVVMQAASSPAMRSALPKVLVHKSPTCGCCGAWVDHLRHAGFQVQVDETDDLGSIREKLGVPRAKASCHTAEVGGYVVEGHVPARDIKRLLAEKPRAKGLVLPGMPMGSPGMESPDGRVSPYTVELVEMNGTTKPYAKHGQ